MQKKPDTKSQWMAKSSQRVLHIVVIATSFLCINFGFVNCSPVHDMNGALSAASSAGSGSGGGTGTGGNPPTPASRYQFTCTPGQTTPSQMQRLSRREYQNTIKDLVSLINASLYDATIQADIATLPDDQTSATINNNAVGEYESTVLVYAGHINGYFQTAFDIGGKIAANATYVKAIPGTNSCLGAATVTDACVTNFINGFGLKVFRRPLTTAEVTQYKAYWNLADFSSTAQKIQGVIAIFLQSPDFLYRIYDQGTVTSATARTLTSYEFASKLSYLITGSMPDATLFAEAASNSLTTPAAISAEVTRLLALPSARPTIARFFKEWLQYDTLPDMTRFPSSVTNGVDVTNLSTNMMNDVDNTIQSVVFDNNGTLQDLMSTKVSYVAGNNLAQIYGITNPNGLVTLPDNRAGIFSRAAFLAKQAQPGTSPVKRGRFLLTSVLCQSIGNPPPGAPAQAPALPPGEFLTTRDRYQFLTVRDQNGIAAVNCMGCHSRMNPLGYTYEAFDPFGRVRSTEPVTNTNLNGQSVTENLPINTQSVTNELDVPNVAMNSYLDLHQYLSTSDKVMSCMSQKWFTFIQKRSPAMAGSDDGCYMNEFLNATYGTSQSGQPGGQGSIQDLIKNTAVSTRFRTWNN